MAQRLFARSTGTANGYTITPAPSHYRDLIATTFAAGSNGSTVVLAAGASAFSYAVNARFATAIPNYTGSLTGQFIVRVQFQSVAPTNVYTKVRVHRATLSGTAYTLATSSEWSEERLTDKITQYFEFYLDQVDLGTWSSTNALVIEYNYRNAGASSISPQATGGNYYANAIYSPFTTSAAYGYTNQLPVGQRVYNYSQGGIRDTSRYLKRTASVNTSSGTVAGRRDNGSVTGVSISTGTATGTKGGQDFSGSVTGVSTSSGTIAAGKQGYSGTITGSSISTGTIAAGRQGYTGSSTGSSTSSGTISAGLQGYSGNTTGSSTSSGTVNGTPGPTPDEGVAVPWWYIEQEQPKQPKPIEILALTGRIRRERIYLTARVRGRAGFAGSAFGTNRVESFITKGAIGYSGATAFDARSTGMATGSRYIFEDASDLLLMMGEL